MLKLNCKNGKKAVPILLTLLDVSCFGVAENCKYFNISDKLLLLKINFQVTHPFVGPVAQSV